jgi:hypothetical protein
VCNVEYLRGRITSDKWIYCTKGGQQDERAVYYSALKQCPACCQVTGLEPRLSGAQHKPSSHHIGEITTTAMALILTLVEQSMPRPMTLGVISKQSHDVDALAWRDDLLVLFEMKASPLVTYPVRSILSGPMVRSSEDGPVELAQHTLVDIDTGAHDLSLYLANTGVDVPLGKPDSPHWPYPEVTSYVDAPEHFLDYLESWLEIFLAYSVPKTHRAGREVALAYLANGWGDEIDSNKTKAGLGRTDDIKKGTYQLLKFGAYYRDGSPDLAIRGALVSNLDPLFMYDQYLAKLVDARWAPNAKFQRSADAEVLMIKEDDLYYIYDGILAFNRPVINDKLLEDCFDIDAFETALVEGRLDSIIAAWRRVHDRDV